MQRHRPYDLAGAKLLLLFLLAAVPLLLYAQHSPRAWLRLHIPRHFPGGGGLILATDSTFYSYWSSCTEVRFGRGRWRLRRRQLVLRYADSAAQEPKLAFSSSASTAADSLTLCLTDCFGAPYDQALIHFYTPEDLYGGYYLSDNSGLLRIPKRDSCAFALSIEMSPTKTFELHDVGRSMADTVFIRLDYPSGIFYNPAFPHWFEEPVKMRLEKKGAVHRLYGRRVLYTDEQ